MIPSAEPKKGLAVWSPTGRICFTMDGTEPTVVDGQCPTTCQTIL